MTIRTPFETPPAEAVALEVASGIFWLRLPLPMALDHVNIYAIRDDEGWTIIDTGFASKRGEALWDAILDGPLKGAPLRRVIVTHHHPDHVGMAAWLMARGAELCMTRTAWLMARMLTLDEQSVPTPEALTYYKRAGMAADVLANRKTERPFTFAAVVRPLPEGYTRLKDGHTSCEKFLPFATDDQLILGGHKLPYTGLPLRLDQMIRNHHEALARLLEHLDVPRSAGECFAPLYKRKIGAGEYGLALVEAVAHLNHLHQTGLANRELGEDGTWLFSRA